MVRWSFFALASLCLAAGCASGGGGRGPLDLGGGHFDGGPRPDGSMSGRDGSMSGGDGSMSGGDGSMSGSDGGPMDTDSGPVGTDAGPPDLGPMCAAAMCDDHNACSMDGCDATGACTHVAIGCDDANMCTTDTCNPMSGCNHTTISCDDSDACTLDGCDATTGCTHMAYSCDDSNACTTDSCAPLSGCQHTTIGCDDGNMCTTDTCSAATGCMHTAITPCGGSPTTVSFPSGGDTEYDMYSAGYMWNVGDYVQGTRVTGLASTTSLSYSFPLTNYVTCDHDDFRMLVNGVEVGRFSVLPGAGSPSGSFSFPRITGPTYTLRYEVVRIVASGCGAIVPDLSGTGSVTLNP